MDDALSTVQQEGKCSRPLRVQFVAEQVRAHVDFIHLYPALFDKIWTVVEEPIIAPEPLRRFFDTLQRREDMDMMYMLVPHSKDPSWNDPCHVVFRVCTPCVRGCALTIELLYIANGMDSCSTAGVLSMLGHVGLKRWKNAENKIVGVERTSARVPMSQNLKDGAYLID